MSGGKCPGGTCPGGGGGLSCHPIAHNYKDMERKGNCEIKPNNLF